MKKTFLVLLVVLVLLVFSSHCYAETFTVSTSAQFQIALNSADLNGEGDIITLLPGTYSGSDSFFSYVPKSEDENLTITGSGEVILDGEGQAGQILYISSPWQTDITLQGLTFRNSVCVSGYGGGAGASIQIQAGNINVVECSFKNNKVPDSWGGGLYASISSNGTINITSCDFTGNLASGYGGGLFAESRGTGGINLKDNSFSENSCTAQGRGGGAYLSTACGTILVTGNTFSDNISYDDAGGIFCLVNEGNLYFADNLLNGNIIVPEGPYQGGGARLGCILGDMTVENCSFTNNICQSSGGGIYCLVIEGNLYFADNLLDGNIVSGDYEGGGAWLETSSADMTVENCSFTHNTCQSHGGGVCTYFYNGDFLFRNNLVADNTSIKSGGGAYLLFHMDGTNPFDIINNTITENTVSGEGYSGGGLYIDGGADNAEYSIYNNIIWGNSAFDGNDIYLNDRGQLNSFSLYNNDFSVLSTDFTGGSVISRDFNFNVDPGFVSDTDYHLMAGSPLIDEGDPLAPSLPETDLDGNARVSGAEVDMGAYEYAPAGDDDDDVSQKTSGSGCNAGAFVPSMLLLLAPLFILARKK